MTEPTKEYIDNLKKIIEERMTQKRERCCKTCILPTLPNCIKT